jgi:hypothetical protein
MEREWERAKARIGLTRSEVREILTSSGIVPVKADLIEEGLANMNYRVVAEDGATDCLRILQRDTSSRVLEVALAIRLPNELRSRG